MFDEADDVKGPYSRVYNEMWASASFRSLSERGRYLFFYLLQLCQGDPTKLSDYVGKKLVMQVGPTVDQSLSLV